MAHRVIWSQRAVRDLEEIADYISRDSPEYAKVVVRNIANRTKALARFPVRATKCTNLMIRTFASC